MVGRTGPVPLCCQSGRQGRPGRQGAEALLHPHPAAERHRQAAHGACPAEHPAGSGRPLAAHARRQRAVAARDGSRRHRHPAHGRAAPGRAGLQPDRTRQGRSSSSGSGSGSTNTHAKHPRPVAASGCFLRLVPRAVHARRRPGARGAHSLRASARRGPDLPRRAHGQLVAGAADGGFRPSRWREEPRG